MPEAAEVAVAVGQLAHVAVGRVLSSVSVTHPRTARNLDGALDHLEGRPVTGVVRHGKWIVLSVDGIEQRMGIHLRMSGQLLAAEVDAIHPDRHVHAVLSLGPRRSTPVSAAPAPPPPRAGAGTGDEACEVWFRDPRTFGEIRILDALPGAPDLFDPRVDGRYLRDRALRRDVGVKAVLLDQSRCVSGIGSYLADESLHRAGISPSRPASTLAPTAWSRILRCARDLVEVSIRAGGVTLADEGWIDLWGRPGRFIDEVLVHGRQRCGTCDAPTRTAVIGGRSARWCPRCQPLRRLR